MVFEYWKLLTLRHYLQQVAAEPRGKLNRGFVMNGYSLYLDAAGHPVDRPYLCLAGFLASEPSWLNFEKAWNACLKKHKIESPFHSTDWFSLNRKNPRRMHALRDLVREIGNHATAAFSVTIDMAEYKRFNEIYPMDEIIGTPYAITARTVIANLDIWRREANKVDPVLLFVESGTLHEGDMRECLRDRDRLPEPTAVPKSLAPCQAADLYAYAVYQLFSAKKKPEIMELFDQKFKPLRERVDGFIGRDDFDRYLSAPRTVVHHQEVAPDGIRTQIPKRSETADITFNFQGNPKRKRMRRVKT